MVGATELSAGLAGLVPAPGKGAADRFLRSDGTWTKIQTSEAHEAQIFSVENTDKKEHTELITDTISGTTLFKGDIFIVKDLIANDKYQHTAYIYNGTSWIAMDGNYSAENVYFTDNFTFTAPVGTVEIPESGSQVVDAKGKNLQEFLASIFAKEKDPKVTLPKVTIKLPNLTSTVYEIGTKLTPKYSITFTPGEYEYGPATGITATYEVTDTESGVGDGTGLTGNLPEFTVNADTVYKATVKASYTEGAVPKSNLGTLKPDLKIAAGNVSAVSSTVGIKGFRKTFYGTRTNKEDLDSAAIRALAGSSTSGLAAGSSFTINIPTGAVRVVFAYPATLRDVNSVKDVNGLNAEIKSAFKQSTMTVAGAGEDAGIEYKVYITDFAEPVAKANSYKVTI